MDPRNGAAEAVLVAVGVFSKMGDQGKTSASDSLSRRMRMRNGTNSFANLGRSVAVRFVIGQPHGALVDEAAAEHSRYGDMIAVALNESVFHCALKPLLWFAACAKVYPRASFYAVADDDTYLQLDHLEADLRSVRAYGHSDHIMYGLVMWYAALDSVTMATHESWGGWNFFDKSARRQRQQMVRCRNATLRTPQSTTAASKGGPCAGLTRPQQHTIERGGLDDLVPPWPVVNGPFYALSATLAQLLIADPRPHEYMRRLLATPFVRAQQAWAQTRESKVPGKRLVPIARVNRSAAFPEIHVFERFGCWPTCDAIIGLWVTQVSQARGVSVQLVNTPFMLQHHPWPATVHGRFSNKSIVQHGLGLPELEPFRAAAQRNGAGPFEPFERKCGDCKRMGWSSWQGSVHARWTCCGCDATFKTKRLQLESIGCCNARLGLVERRRGAKASRRGGLK